jgi:hypothetical protein
LNQDFLDMLSALSAAGAEYLVVGAHALSVHGFPRATGDLDIWVRPTQENADCVLKAIKQYGAPHRKLSREDLSTPNTVFQIGVAPNRIDVLTSIDGVEFDEAWQSRKQTSVDAISFFVIGRDLLLKNKLAQE